MIIRSCNQALRFFPSVAGCLENVSMQDLTLISLTQTNWEPRLTEQTIVALRGKRLTETFMRIVFGKLDT